MTSALEGQLTVLASVPLMVEYEAVPTRPEHLDAAGLTAEDVRTVLDALATVVEPVRLASLWRPLLTDVADDMVLETAVNGRADLLVTMNRRDFEPAIDRSAAHDGRRVACRTQTAETAALTAPGQGAPALPPRAQTPAAPHPVARLTAVTA